LPILLALPILPVRLLILSASVAVTSIALTGFPVVPIAWILIGAILVRH